MTIFSRRTGPKKTMTMEEVHDAIVGVDRFRRSNDNGNENETDLSDTHTHTTLERKEFHDCLQSLRVSSRPQSVDDIVKYCQNLGRAVETAGEDRIRWVLLTSLLLYRRFHQRAPEAKTNHDGSSTGDGERRLFYVAVLFLGRIAKRNHDECIEGTETSMSTSTSTSASKAMAMTRKAVACLLRLADRVGGSRDVCTLLEWFVYDALVADERMRKVLAVRADLGPKATLLAAVRRRRTIWGETNESVTILSQTAASMIDADLALVRGGKKQKQYHPHPHPSTIHTFVPHNGRGPRGKSSKTSTSTSTSSKSCRNLVQTLAELSVWTRTKAFADAKLYLKDGNDNDNGNGNANDSDETVMKSLHAVQTAIRRFRKQLNADARQRGHSLKTSFVLDPSKLTSSMIRVGKQGDLMELKRLASKRRHLRTLRLLAMTAHAKPMPYDSVTSMLRGWVPLLSTTHDHDHDRNEHSHDNNDDDELVKLEKELQKKQVCATLEDLRGAMKTTNSENNENSTTILVASMDGFPSNDASAVLLAAAMNNELELDVSQKNDDTDNDTDNDNDTNNGDGDDHDEKNPSKQARFNQSTKTKHEAVVVVGTQTMSKVAVRLFLKDTTHKVDTLDQVMQLLDTSAAAQRSNQSYAASSASSTSNNGTGEIAAATRDVQNFINRHMMKKGQKELPSGANDTNRHRHRLLLFGMADLKLERRVLEALQQQRGTIHYHLQDDFSSRMEREGARKGDITATLAWDNRCDLDLHAICPDGTHIHYGNTFAEGYGNLDVDMNVNGESTEPVENIFFGDADRGVEAPKGNYKLYVQNFRYHGNLGNHGHGRPVPVPWRLRLLMNDVATEYTGECVGTGETSNVTVCDFEYKGRTRPMSGLTEPSASSSSSSSLTPTALESSDLVAVTSSAGSTLDSLRQLVNVFDQHAVIGQMRDVNMDDEDAQSSKEEEEQPEPEPDHGQQPPENNDNDTDTINVVSYNFEITNREKLYMDLSSLPQSFHQELARTFGGAEGDDPLQLSRVLAQTVAKRLVDSGTPIKAMRQAGYPQDVVDLVKTHMSTFGMGV